MASVAGRATLCFEPRLKSSSERVDGAIVLDNVEHVSSPSNMSAWQHDLTSQEPERLATKTNPRKGPRSKEKLYN
eukprot:2754086-Amphidinium_carterae.1